MFVDFFYQLRDARIPVTIREFLTFLEALEKGVAQGSIDEFYYLSRAALVKDERWFDTFDLVFENFFKGAMNKTSGLLEEYLPEEWLRGMARELFTEEEIEAMNAEIEKDATDAVAYAEAAPYPAQSSAGVTKSAWRFGQRSTW